MAQVERAQEEKKANTRLKAAKLRNSHRRMQGSYQLSIRHHAALMGLIQAFAEKGGAVRIGLTRDGGALALGMYLEDDYTTEYVRPQEDIVDACMEISGVWFNDNGDAWIAAVRELGVEGWLEDPKLK